MKEVFYDGSGALVRVVILGVVTYAAVVVTLRVTGKRTLAKMNAFDLIVTVALGSILAATVVNEDLAVAEGLVAIAILVVLQFAITWSSVRLPWLRRVVTGDPRTLVVGGRFLPDAMKRERITREEVLAAVRAAGMPDLQHVASVTLETDGSLSVVRRQEGRHNAHPHDERGPR